MITQGLGLHWSLTDPFMTAILGGGENPRGFQRIANHLGPGLWAWTKDMQELSVENKIFEGDSSYAFDCGGENGQVGYGGA
jgi:hypothetical protein